MNNEKALVPVKKRTMLFYEDEVTWEFCQGVAANRKGIDTLGTVKITV